MDRLRGSAETTVDDKGRFKVPAIFREQIESLYGSEFFVTSLTASDVLIYPLPVWTVLEEKFAALSPVHPVRTKFLDRFNSFGQVVKMDGQGRLLIPSLLREMAGVSGDALVLGQTDYLKLVHRERHLEALRSTSLTEQDYDALAAVLG